MLVNRINPFPMMCPSERVADSITELIESNSLLRTKVANWDPSCEDTVPLSTAHKDYQKSSGASNTFPSIKIAANLCHIMCKRLILVLSS